MRGSCVRGLTWKSIVLRVENRSTIPQELDINHTHYLFESSPENRRFHTKNEMRVYIENNPDLELSAYSHALTDFGVHLKLARRLGWIARTPDGAARGPDARAQLADSSPLVKRRKLGLKRDAKLKRKPKLTIKMKIPQAEAVSFYSDHHHLHQPIYFTTAEHGSPLRMRGWCMIVYYC